MLYNIYSINNSYLCSVNREKTTKMYHRFPKGGKHKNRITMKKIENEIMMLQYRIRRYQTMRNGAMCQALQGRLQKLLAKQA